MLCLMSISCPSHVHLMSISCPPHVRLMSVSCPSHVHLTSVSCPSHVRFEPLQFTHIHTQHTHTLDPFGLHLQPQCIPMMALPKPECSHAKAHSTAYVLTASHPPNLHKRAHVYRHNNITRLVCTQSCTQLTLSKCTNLMQVRPRRLPSRLRPRSRPRLRPRLFGI